MSGTDVIKPLQGTAFFSRKVSDGNYGSIEASHFVQYDQSTENGAALAFCEAKCNVLEQLGLAYEATPEGVIIETSVDTFKPVVFTGQAQTARAVEQAFAPTSQRGPTHNPPSGGTAKVKVWKRPTFPDGRLDDKGQPAKLGNPSWLVAAAAEKGITDVWDNRLDSTAFGGSTANGKRPWFREKDGEQGIWPPRDHPDGASNYIHPDFVGDPRSTPNADEESF